MKNKFLILRQMLTWEKWGYDSKRRTLIFFTCNFMDVAKNGKDFICGYKPKVWISDVSFMDFAKLFLNKKLRATFTAEIDIFHQIEKGTESDGIPDELIDASKDLFEEE